MSEVLYSPGSSVGNHSENSFFPRNNDAIRNEMFESQSGRSASGSFGKTTRQESFTVVENESNYTDIEKPDKQVIEEVSGLLKVQSSMLAVGACERVKRLAKAHPRDIISSPIIKALIEIISASFATPLGESALSALISLAYVPEGRKYIVLLDGVSPVLRFIRSCDLGHPNTDKAVQLLMNLAADSSNRRTIREAGGVEALVHLSSKSSLGSTMVYSMGALHNLLLTDSKARRRAVDVGVAYPLARVLGARLEEGALLRVRAHILISDLLRIEDLKDRLIDAAYQQGIFIPGIMPPPVRMSNNNSLISQRSELSSASPTPQSSVKERVEQHIRVSEMGHASIRAPEKATAADEAPGKNYESEEEQLGLS